jgi:soluble lytic murein transglycosylase-like protein
MTAYRPQIEKAARAHNLDADLVEAMVVVESDGRAWAWNPEPHYRYLWNVRTQRPFRALGPGEASSKWPPADFPTIAGDRDQEWWGQQASWGLLQVMGAVARERGFRGLYLPELCDPVLNLDVGCRHYAAFLRWAGGDMWKAVAAYNGGQGNWNGAAPQVHVTKVKRALAVVQATR